MSYATPVLDGKRCPVWSILHCPLSWMEACAVSVLVSFLKWSQCICRRGTGGYWESSRNLTIPTDGHSPGRRKTKYTVVTFVCENLTQCLSCPEINSPFGVSLARSFLLLATHSWTRGQCWLCWLVCGWLLWTVGLVCWSETILIKGSCLGKQGLTLAPRAIDEPLEDMPTSELK